ncbi:MAG TPA: YdcF family protein [Pseudonocardiaceae bacterium]|nr:YdcF family protein [Pseudonocardiaceae bacterium]
MAAEESTLPASLRSDVELLWDYHDLCHDLRPCGVAIGLGSHDPGVAIYIAELFHRAMFPLVVFTGANAPTTVDRFPRGEAVHYRDYAIELGVPPEAIRVEPAATNTGQNIEFTRRILADEGVDVCSILLVSRPYQQRRAFATCKKLWPEVEVRCVSRPLLLDEYIASIGDAKLVISMLVGDTQRITEYAKRGFAIEQEMPPRVQVACQRLIDAGFTDRLI